MVFFFFQPNGDDFVYQISSGMQFNNFFCADFKKKLFYFTIYGLCGFFLEFFEYLMKFKIV